MTDPEVIRAWFTAHLDEDERLAQGADGADWYFDRIDDSAWPFFEQDLPARALRAVVAKRAILAALPANPDDDPYVRLGGWGSCGDSCPADLLVQVLRQLAQEWADDPTMPEELKLA